MDLIKRNDAPLSIRLFGAMEVSIEGAPLPKMRTRKEISLLAILILARGREVPRQSVSQALWPDEGRFPLDLGYNLRRSLANLRKALGTQAYRLHTSEPQHLRFDLTEAQVDLLDFEQVVNNASLDTTAKLEALMSLYRGPLLADCQEEWADGSRERYRYRYHRTLLALAETASTAGELRTAICCLKQASELDRASEATHRALMRSLIANGEYEEALRIYKEFERHLRHILDVHPGSETVDLYEYALQELRARPAAVSGFSAGEEGGMTNVRSRAHAILRDSWEDWRRFDRPNALLLPADRIALLLEHVPASRATAEEVCFVICSAFHLTAPSRVEPHSVAAWVSARGDAADLLVRLTRHADARIRFGAATLARFLSDNGAGDILTDLLLHEPDNGVKREALRSLTAMGIPLSETLSAILASDNDWLVRAYAVTSKNREKACLLLPDSTEFAEGLRSLAVDNGFTVVRGPESILFPRLSGIDQEMLRTFGVIILARGEHFTQWGNASLRALLKQFVQEGGTLFATSWVS